jgi:Mrp family chromosome partitioning ATPase
VRAELSALGAKVATVQLAGERRLAVGGELGEVLTDGVQRGSVVSVGGPAGAGVTRTAFELAASVTAAGEWVAFVDAGGTSTLGIAAAAELGVELERAAVVHDVPDGRWPVVVGALLDGMTMVVAVVPPRLALGDARRLLARARERRAVLVALEAAPLARAGAWPAEAAVRVHVHDTSWQGLDAGGGLLSSCTARIDVEGRGMLRQLARAG